MRSTKLPSSNITALDLLQRFATYLDDECRLQRIVPYPRTLTRSKEFVWFENRYIISMLSDARAMVRATAVRTLSHVVSNRHYL